MTLTLTLTAPVSVATTVSWATVPGTATAGVDYQAVTAGTATFAAGSSVAQITVT